jgi:hypothetical protein
MESSDSVRTYINAANEDFLKELQTTEKLQLSVYNDLLLLLTKELFFQPLLESRSKQIVGRFCLLSNIAINASYLSYGTSEFLDAPGHFELEFASSGLPNVSSTFDSHLSASLTRNPTPHVKKTIRSKLNSLGWKAWWYDGKFCFQAIPDSKLIEETILLANMYSSIPDFILPTETSVHQSPIVYDHSSIQKIDWSSP